MNHLNRDWLFQKYITEGLSTYDIAKIVERDPKRVYEKLREFGIPTRPRGQNLKGADNYMAGGNTAPFKGRRHTEATKAVLSEKAKRPKPYLRGSKNGMYMRRDAKHPRWKGKESASRPQGRVEYKEWRAAVIARLGSQCFVCGKDVQGVEVQAHHILPWTTHPECRYDTRNGIVLCRRCHGQAHK